MENGRDYLQHVLNCLCTRLAQIDQAILEGEKEVEDMHEYYWENYTEMDEYGYENYDNQQALFHQMHANEEQFLLRKRFKKMLDSPFFGRVDFVYDGELRSAVCFMIMIKDRRLMRHLPEPFPGKWSPSGNTRSDAVR